MRRAGLLPILLLLGWSFPTRASQPVLVKDVNPLGSLEAVDLSQLVTVGPRVVLVLSRASTDDAGGELWASDGTDGGTGLLRSFVRTHSQVTILGSSGRVAFVLITTQISPEAETAAVWRTDGTAAGTFQVAGPFAFGWFPLPPVSGRLFFTGCSGVRDCEPWVSDGTPGGTRRLRDIVPGEYGSDPGEFVSAGDRVYFFATAPDGPGLWRTDGTRPGTRRVYRFSPYVRPENLTALGGRLFFTVWPEDNLWTSDGTAAGTRPVPPFDRPDGRGSKTLGPLVTAGGLVYFRGFDPVLGDQIYRTDGTPEGTRRITSDSSSEWLVGGTLSVGKRLVFLGPNRQLWTSAGSRASTHPLTGCPGGCPEAGEGLYGPVSGGLGYFSGTLGGETGLWVTDGTGAGTRRLLQTGSPPQFGPVVDGRVTFVVSGDLWSTDGTPAGTLKVGEGARVTNDGAALVAAAGSRLVFAGYEPGAPPESRVSLLKSTGGTLGSERTLDLGLNDGSGSDPWGFTDLGDAVLFSVCSPPLGGVWTTRGTPETTTELTEAQVPCGYGRTAFSVLGGAAYFRASRPGETWSEVWRTDGTPEGTRQLSHVGPRKSARALTVFRNELIFIAQTPGYDDPGPASTMWASDGTEAGTRPLFDLAASDVLGLSVLGDALYFQGRDGTEYWLFRSDGTAAGTRALCWTGGNGRNSSLAEIGGEVFFLRGDDSADVWRTNGTPEGTRALTLPWSGVRYVQGLARHGGRLYFMGIDPENFNLVDYEEAPSLFRSDGTLAGTVRLKKLGLERAGEYPDVPPTFPEPQFTSAAGLLFFVAFDAARGEELWRTDGTPAGTVLVSDINPGPAPSSISGLTAAGDRVFFAADDGERGVELWTSDGTPAGTRRLADILAGPLSSSPQELTVAGGHLFFSADDGVNGREPWMLPLDFASAPRGKP